jgi:hypothetical protein
VPGINGMIRDRISRHRSSFKVFSVGLGKVPTLIASVFPPKNHPLLNDCGSLQVQNGNGKFPMSCHSSLKTGVT